MYRLTKAEQETVIQRSADEAFYTVTTSLPRDMKKVRVLAERLGLPVVQWDQHTIRVRLPQSVVRWITPHTTTEAERVQRSAALAKARAAQKGEGVAG